ncbi:FtsK/SpoIIIE domain-containing protein [Humibacter ginsenosidimutans]|uniref:FHA domain-containing protein n=1 Tax=Humibacter ginsenosidimutans TaxID=2599293 RepID=A0A5B8M5A2_9MICO|nr:FtsK/SpoIIIE domain-containing protein [Humibacter ginsenosidimutans]QDZ15025.1 FHA domain-containing protein [Humibacter ginsenosidimutans]
MRLKLTLNRPSGQPADIVVTADAAASISEIAAAVQRLDPTANGADAYAATPSSLTLHAALPGQTEWVLLPPDAPVGEAWIASGAMVQLADSGLHYQPKSLGRGAQVATLTVLSGPDAGSEFPITLGTTVLGRDPGCDIVLHDKLVSKRHVRFEASDAVEVIDLGSANGIVVDGGIVPRLRVTREETLLIGGSEVRLTITDRQALAGVAPKAGPVFFNRSPKVEARYAGQEFGAPEVPTKKEPMPFPLLAMIAPILMGGVMFAVSGQATSLLFVLMSPLMMVGNSMTAKARDKRRLKKSIAEFDERLESLAEELASERTTEHDTRAKESPSTEDALAQAVYRGPLLWTRRPEHWSFLNVRLGVGAMASRNTIKQGGRGEILKAYQERLDEVVEKHKNIDDVPIIDNLFDSGALGIAGSPQQAIGSLNSIMAQLTALHSPAELAVAAIVSPRWSQELEWLKWIPHTSSPQSPIETGHLADSAASGTNLLSALEGLIDARLADNRSVQRRGAIQVDSAALERGADVGKDAGATGTKSPIPAVVVLISDDAAVDRARLVQVAERAADAGVYPIWIANDVPSLPAVCRTYLELGDEPGRGRVGFVRLGETIENVATETVDGRQALEFARRMAAVIDASALVADSSDLPRSVSMVTLLGHELAETSDAVVDRWRQNNSIHDRSGGPLTPRRVGTLRATIGSGGVDVMHLDLRAQGPHALVGGTTGAGKSEFLQAWVLGMAAEYSPDRVTFLFVDYKGGSAFADCVSLPHCVGLVTDLSPHLVRRALTSLRAELHHREHLLNRKKAKDLLELEKRGDPDSPPALVLVIDEFAALVGEVPEFVDGVVDIAQRGRSLGIHLIMATQRPAGVIKDNLRANTNLRVALRMADESDSDDVVGTKEAAHFDPGIPGRGVAKTGPGRLTLFQSGYAGGWTSREPERAGIEVAELRFGGEVRWEEPGGGEQDVDLKRDLGPTDQQRLVTAMVGAQQVAGIPSPRRPWLDELATAYDLSMLRQRTDAELLLGVADVPERQEQVPVYFEPDVDGNIAIYGTGGSGKSSVLRTLACSAAITPRGGPVWVYALDFGAGSLRMLDQLPHVGAVIKGDDIERVVRLFRMLRAQLDDRAPRFAEANASNITEYRQLAGRPDEPRILLLLDGFPSFREDFEVAANRAPSYETFRDVLTDGRQLGMHVAFTADRAGAVPGAVGSSVQRKVVLRLADDGYSLLDAPGDVLSASSPPGRAIVDGMETQIAVLGGTSSVSEQSAKVGKLAEAMARAGVTTPPAIGSMPTEYAQSTLPDRVNDFPVLGIGEQDLEPVGFDPTGTMVLAGPPASGRSTAFLSVAQALHRFDPGFQLYYLGNARSPLVRAYPWADVATTVEEVGGIAKDLLGAVTDVGSADRFGIFIESIGDFLQSTADAPLVELIKAVRRSSHFLLAEGETSGWGSSWGLMAEVKNGRRGLLLQPESMEGDLLLKTPLPRFARSEFPPGRGMYIAKGTFERVQVPLP